MKDLNKIPLGSHPMRTSNIHGVVKFAIFDFYAYSAVSP